MQPEDVSKIKAQRIKLGLTQEELGNLVGLSESAISRLERGQRVPSYDKARLLAEVLNISMEEIRVETVPAGAQ